MNQTNPIYTDLMWNLPSTTCSAYIKETKIMKVYKKLLYEEMDNITKYFQKKNVTREYPFMTRERIMITFYTIERLREDQLDYIIENKFSILDLLKHLNGVKFRKDYSSPRVQWDK